MNKKEWQNELINNPSLSSGMVDIMSAILEEYSDFRIEDLSVYNEMQLRQIRDHLDLKKNIFYSDDSKFKDEALFDSYIDPSFNDTQMYLINNCIKDKCITNDEILKLICNNNIPYAKMNYIYMALKDGFNHILDFINYDAEQIYEIYNAMKAKLDINKITKKEYTAEQMGLISHALQIGAHVIAIHDDNEFTFEF